MSLDLHVEKGPENSDSDQIRKIPQSDKKRMTKMPSGAKFLKGTSFQGGSLFFLVFVRNVANLAHFLG
jgi:hypothetical protein